MCEERRSTDWLRCTMGCTPSHSHAAVSLVYPALEQRQTKTLPLAAHPRTVDPHKSME